MDAVRIFSIKTRPTFFLLVVCLCLFSIGSWWAVRSLVWSEVTARLNSNGDRIAGALRERLRTQGNTLIHVRADFKLRGIPQGEDFRSLISSLELPLRFPGAMGIGVAELFPRRGVPAQMARPVLMEPANWMNEGVLLTDMMTEPHQRSAIDRAIQTGDIAITDPIPLFYDDEAKESRGIFMFLAVYSKGYNLALNPRQAKENAQAVIFAPFRIREFIEGTFGAPSLAKESVNFVVVSKGEQNEDNLLYNRFDIGENEAQPWITIERPLDIYGKKITLKVYPLPHFYSFADQYLALIVGLGAALLSCLVMIVMRVSQNQLDFETLAKESSMEAARQSHKQIENLRKLNEFDRSLAGELDIEALVGKFFHSLGQLAQVDSCFLFFARRPASNGSLLLRDTQGLQIDELKAQSVPLAWVEKLFTQSLYLRKGAHGSEEVIRTLMKDPAIYSDWLLALVSTRETGRCGLIFAGKKNDGVFTEVELEMFESMISQFASGIEIAQLFERVEDASKAKNAFLANMSHEIRTPLSAIIGFSDMLRREELSQQQKESVVQNIKKNGDQLTCIIDDILDLSKVEAGKLRIERKRLRLASLVHEIKSLMELRARDKGIQFTIEPVGSLPSHIETDEVRLKQVLMNLVGNAIKFTERGRVSLIVRYVQTEMKDNQIVFTIRDSGIGIPDEAQAGLFRPFSQVDPSNTRKFGGSGLGLALSRRLAQELGGDVSLLESIKGKGSTFEARISIGALVDVSWNEDIFPKWNPPPSLSIVPQPKLDGLKVLVVEDSEDNQEIFRYFLEKSGAETEIVGDGIQAVSTAAQKSYDMILMDIQIPGIDGKEATRRIRKLGFKKPIVALTAHAMPEEQESCIQAGCNGQITKPVSGEALVSQVAGYAGRI